MTSRLFPNRISPHKNSNTFKYRLNCQERLQNTAETNLWLELLSSLPHDSPDYKLYSGLLDKHHSIVAKIGRRSLSYEFSVSKLIETVNIPTFLSYFCEFSCLDTFSLLNDTTKYLCKQQGQPIHVILMPYVNRKQIQDIHWKEENLLRLQSIFKHILYSTFYVSKQTGISQGDLHLGNILIRNTTRKEISYGELGLLPVDGLMPIILDFDRAKKEKEPQSVYSELRRYFLLAAAEIPLSMNKSKIVQKLQDLYSFKIPITKQICDELSNEIDLIEFQRATIQQQLPNWLKPMKV
jgi:hypothetical protein